MGLSSLGLLWYVIYAYAMTVVSLITSFDTVVYGTLHLNWLETFGAAFAYWNDKIITNLLY